MIPTFLMAMSIVQFGCFKPAVYRIPQSFITHFPPFIGGRSFKTAYMFVVFPFLAFFFGSSELFLISRQNHLILTDRKLNTHQTSSNSPSKICRSDFCLGLPVRPEEVSPKIPQKLALAERPWLVIPG